uniref:Uncharacterized protein n=1 Tax=Rhizophora mucronata TaxID=61149 RepID=A0A2P2IN45_RHIMU
MTSRSYNGKKQIIGQLGPRKFITLKK